MTTEVWSGKRVFLTGHTGFKGSWMALWLKAMGAEVLGYSLPAPTKPSMFELAAVGDAVTSVVGDVRDLEKLTSEMTRFRPEVVFHLAAQSLVRPSYRDPVETFSTNVMGTVHVLEAIRRAPSIKAAVMVTSDKCYENNEWAWGYRESDPMGGYDPYSNSKGCAELVTSSYRRSFFSASTSDTAHPAVASARAGNVIGGGDFSLDRLVPDFMRAMSAGEPVRIRNPGAQRPWQHVLEPLCGYITLAERLLQPDGQNFATGWNFGPRDEDAIHVESLVQKFVGLWGAGAKYSVDASPQPHEATYLKLDTSRARALLGWKTHLGVESAIDWTVEWHKACSSGLAMRELTESQITRFSAMRTR